MLRSTGSGLHCSALLSRSPAPDLQLQKRHDKMVAALLHRQLRVPPWARQGGLWARVCVPCHQREALLAVLFPVARNKEEPLVLENRGLARQTDSSIPLLADRL